MGTPFMAEVADLGDKFCVHGSLNSVSPLLLWSLGATRPWVLLLSLGATLGLGCYPCPWVLPLSLGAALGLGCYSRL